MTRVHLLQETISDQIVGRGTENALCDIASDALSLVGVTLFNMRSKSDQVRPRAGTARVLVNQPELRALSASSSS
jgi:hypothetical protein